MILWIVSCIDHEDVTDFLQHQTDDEFKTAIAAAMNGIEHTDQNFHELALFCQRVGSKETRHIINYEK